MKISKIIIYLLLILTACKNHSENETPKTVDTFVQGQITEVKSNNEAKDSLRNPSSFYFLTDYPLRKCGYLFLKDSIHPTDNQITFDCMDSISSRNKDTRDFFFPVFLKIVSKSDGALSEAAGSYVMKYVENYTKEFASRSKSLTDSSLKSIAYFAANEVGYKYDDNPEKWTNQILDKCKNCDSSEITRLKLFNKIIVEAIEEYKE
mgnify:CR=1 FL=1